MNQQQQQQQHQQQQQQQGKQINAELRSGKSSKVSNPNLQKPLSLRGVQFNEVNQGASPGKDYQSDCSSSI